MSKFLSDALMNPKIFDCFVFVATWNYDIRKSETASRGFRA